ncbi:Acetyltransferase [Apiospora arundinis]
MYPSWTNTKAASSPQADKFLFELVDRVEVNGSDSNKNTYDEKKNDEGDFDQGVVPRMRLWLGPDQSFSRAYSLTAGNLRYFELGVARKDNLRGGSVYLHDDLEVGDPFEVQIKSTKQALLVPGHKSL